MKLFEEKSPEIFGGLRPLKNGADNNYLPFQDHFCLKKGNYRG